MIPLTKPYWGVREEKVAVRAIRKSHGSGDGHFSKKLEKALQDLTGAKYVFPVTSCTHGMELAMMAFGIGLGDEVILPSFTMSSTANSILLQGATPVFADIDPVYFNIDPNDIKRKITKNTKGIAIVHYAGMVCRMDEILAIAKKHKLFVMEDAAHAIGAYYHGKMLGNLSDIGVYSFHGTKNISCGEGGAVLTNNDKLAEKMYVLRANGTNRKQFMDGVVDKYSWVDKGSSYFLSDILCSIALEQVYQIDKINRERNKIACYYLKELEKVIEDNSSQIRSNNMDTGSRSRSNNKYNSVSIYNNKYQTLFNLPQIPSGCTPNWHIFALKFHDAQAAREFRQRMRLKGIEVSSHYVPLHSAPMGNKIKSQIINSKSQIYSKFQNSNKISSKKTVRSVLNTKDPQDDVELPVTDDVASTIVRFPIYPGLTKKELAYITITAKKILRLG